MSFPEIVCTLGRATDEPSVLRGMMAAGMGLARVNTAYASLEELEQRMRGLRAAGPAGLMVDLKGPQIRFDCTTEKHGVRVPARYPIAEGDLVYIGFTDDAPVRFNHDFEEDLEPGDLVLFQNGRIRMRVADPAAAGVEPRAAAVLLQVLDAGEGTLSPQGGANVPGKRLRVPQLSVRDRQSLALGVSLGAEWYALSFVRDAGDVRHLHEELVGAGDARAGICPKIEEASGIERLDEIVGAVHECGRPVSVMIARGDLFVELPAVKLPRVQARLLSRCHELRVPAIVATGLLLSMQQSPLPARSEVCDVAAALLGGADSLLLSDETGNGKDPVAATEMLAALIREYKGASEVRQ